MFLVHPLCKCNFCVVRTMLRITNKHACCYVSLHHVLKTYKQRWESSMLSLVISRSTTEPGEQMTTKHHPQSQRNIPRVTNSNASKSSASSVVATHHQHQAQEDHQQFVAVPSKMNSEIMSPTNFILFLNFSFIFSSVFFPSCEAFRNYFFQYFSFNSIKYETRTYRKAGKS